MSEPLEQKAKYSFLRSERAVVMEIYFPMKAAYQGVIFNTLRRGNDVKEVKDHLIREVVPLMKELKDYSRFFNPKHYEEDGIKRREKFIPTEEEALERIEMYGSIFKGWSMYEVKGVWFASEHEVYEELTQVVRIMFRLPKTHEKEADEAGCQDVLRSIIYWCIENHGNLDEHRLWDEEEQEIFIAYRQVWIDKKLEFAKKYFNPIAKQVARWIDDCALFVFGYLVKKFADNVLVEKQHEEEIWVTSLFNLTVNVVKKL